MWCNCTNILLLPGKVLKTMNRSVLFYIAAALAGICFLLAVYYMIPGIYHPFVAYTSDAGLYLVDPAKKPHFVDSPHHVYAAGFFVLTLVFALFAFLLRKKRAFKAA